MSHHDKALTEQIIGVVKAYSVGNPDSVVVVIPKDAHDKLGKPPRGQRFLVKIDQDGRLIYEPLKTGGRKK